MTRANCTFTFVKKRFRADRTVKSVCGNIPASPPLGPRTAEDDDNSDCEIPDPVARQVQDGRRLECDHDHRTVAEQSALAAELRDRIRQTGVKITVGDRLTRKQYSVEPRPYEGRLLHQLPAVRTPFDDLYAGLYLNEDL